jgi:tRNA (guanine37-N1)-methyltransferase
MTPAETFVALVHHPVLDRHGRAASTALTTLDLHDIARSARTYGLGGFFIVHPAEAQQAFARRIADHWLVGSDEPNDHRKEALRLVAVVATLDEARAEVATRTGRSPRLIATAARPSAGALGFAACRALPGPSLLVLGTGHGLADEALRACDGRLRPIYRQGGGPSDYNHLSVRSACAILLDRLHGDRED